MGPWSNGLSGAVSLRSLWTATGGLGHALPVKSFAGRVLLLMIVVMLLPVSEPGAYAAPAEKQPQPAPTQSPSPGAQAPQAPKEPPASIPTAAVPARATELVTPRPPLGR